MEVERVIQGGKKGNTNSAWYNTIQIGNIQTGGGNRPLLVIIIKHEGVGAEPFELVRHEVKYSMY